MTDRDEKTGVLLINLGTPDAPTPAAVRRYLREFLSDPRVLDMHPAARWLLLRLVILPLRPRRSAEAYQKIWTREGSPLLVHGQALRDGVAHALGPGYAVELGMRYGRPSIASALGALSGSGLRELLVFPLFPQHSEAASGSALAEVFEQAARFSDLPAGNPLPAFYDHPGFVSAFARIAEPRLREFRPDHVLFSYHGLPERQLRRADPSGAHCLQRSDCCNSIGETNRNCYRAQCVATSRALAKALDLPAERHSLSFQSRLGRTPWIRPYTDQVLPELAGRGVKRLAVLCPAFVADCLETLEEIGIRARQQWIDHGGEALLLVPCPNAHPSWIEAVADMIRAHR